MSRARAQSKGLFTVTPEEFWAKIMPAPNTGCWLWMGRLYCAGHGMTRFIGRRYHVSNRVAWMLTYGKIPEGYDVVPRCRVSACCNPAHLTAMPKAERHTLGVRVSAERRQALKPGQRFGNTRLTAADVLEIRRLAISGMRRKDIGARYGLKPRAIGAVVNRENHKWCIEENANG